MTIFGFLVSLAGACSIARAVMQLLDRLEGHRR